LEKREERRYNERDKVEVRFGMGGTQ